MKDPKKGHHIGTEPDAITDWAEQDAEAFAEGVSSAQYGVSEVFAGEAVEQASIISGLTTAASADTLGVEAVKEAGAFIGLAVGQTAMAVPDGIDTWAVAESSVMATRKGQPGPPKDASTDIRGKGDITLLRKADGSFYVSVDFPTAERYAGISDRRRQQLMIKGTFTVVGKGHNRRITVESLIAFCPPAEEAK